MGGFGVDHTLGHWSPAANLPRGCPWGLHRWGVNAAGMYDQMPTQPALRSGWRGDRLMPSLELFLRYGPRRDQ
jgi:hypothetical protein